MHFLLAIALTAFNIFNLFQPDTVLRTLQFYDGNNITVIERGVKTKVSLACIIAPEISAEAIDGDRARDALVSLLSDAQFGLKVFGKNHYGRLIAEIFANGTNVNKTLVEQGNAYYDPGYGSECDEYEGLEQIAKQNKRGLWRDS
ncbi:nuclease (SNase domain-containing protein) [Thalassoporum mexicanum PCC 7367]|uniref:thermonuclease family protein n=1 Tax=Thalassoporum mexicanum TaxID=3457544 RepID=UPI00029FD6F5|nr:thermonuclease family protein [Pseudanabaena sp. PCC 7367]AFY71695.1 nuclease (SNase domain-containing protein) [Pseudanabaena sp. PCC 7367]